MDLRAIASESTKIQKINGLYRVSTCWQTLCALHTVWPDQSSPPRHRLRRSFQRLLESNLLDVDHCSEQSSSL